jgi:hypothetical protein
MSERLEPNPKTLALNLVNIWELVKEFPVVFQQYLSNLAKRSHRNGPRLFLVSVPRRE